MLPIFPIVVLCLVAFYFLRTYQQFQKNLAAARQSGLRLVETPVYTFNRFWLVTNRLWMPLIRCLPKSWTSQWFKLLDPDWVWGGFYDYFEQLGTGTFLAVSPGRNILYTGDADVIAQITSRRNDFPKPVELYKAIDVYGRNVVSSEGSVWRHHRKITAAPFTEKSNALVFEESIKQASSMLDGWTTASSRPSGGSFATVKDISAATMRLSLHVISRAGFGVKLSWPHEQAGGKPVEAVPAGHSMSYKHALEHLLRNIVQVIIFPRWLMANSPFKKLRTTQESYVEWGKYMNEIYEEKVAEVAAGKSRNGMDLMGALVRGAGNPSAADPTKRSLLLDEDEVLGNAFVFILAGHETAANTLHYTMLYLAIYPESRQKLQKDLDDNGFSKTLPQNWDYDRDINKLHGSMAGAIMNEVLRLVPPVIIIFKRTADAQPLTVEGRRAVVPANSTVALVTVAAHRNPNFWPSIGQPARHDLNTFRPERWLNTANSNPSGQASGRRPKTTDATEETDEPEGADTVESLYRPPKGAYIPFSEGARSCLGRRFAQVEILAVLAVLFRTHSVELAVDEWASDAEVEAMPKGGPERAALYQKARGRALHMLHHNMGTFFTLMMDGHVPVRFMKRGDERFS